MLWLHWHKKLTVEGCDGLLLSSQPCPLPTDTRMLLVSACARLPHSCLTAGLGQLAELSWYLVAWFWDSVYLSLGEVGHDRAHSLPLYQAEGSEVNNINETIQAHQGPMLSQIPVRDEDGGKASYATPSCLPKPEARS